MKLRVTFKDPDTLTDSIEEAKRDLARQLMRELNLSEKGADAEAEARFEKMEKLTQKYFEYQEYVTIEIDDENESASVVPNF